MEAKLFKDGKEICIVQVLKYNPPKSEGIRIDQIGEGSTLAMPGTIKISLPVLIETDGLFSIEIDQKVMALDFTELTTSSVPNQGAVCIAQGFIC